MPPADTRMTSLDWLLLLALSILWGCSFLFGRIAVAEVPPLTLVLARVGIAALALHLVLRVAGIRFAPGAARWRDYAVMGLLNNLVPFGLIFFGQLEIGAGLAAVINGMTPFWSALIARASGAERLPLHKVVGVILGFAGLAVTVGPAALDGLDAPLIAQLAVVGATISYGAASVFGRRFAGQPPLVTATGQLSASTLLVLPLALVVDMPWTLRLPGPAALGAVLGLALISTALAYILFFRVLASAGATNVALVTLLIPVSAMALGALILGEIVEPRQLGGMGMIALGLAVIDGRLLDAVCRRPPSGVDGRAGLPR
ncbi:DMT family transporter [Thalassobaculum sp. OXR-137]|uniref:DMT family transporter n=1 Tax=Thalassobaculum sp. OXR-137 TaxID=3100173 RepID=UPI002AC8DB77|nr:DMT family transporter [Thalassobaculum sp. OXR-137]WPZ33934.1 DMT family transporter [Thalassobaculum sp. OXR-137]